MKVADLKDKSKVDDITLTIVSKGEIRQVNSKFGETLTVCECVAKDDTGETVVSLWNDEIAKVEAGDTVRITNGWASAFRNKLSISAGKFGKLEKL